MRFVLLQYKQSVSSLLPSRVELCCAHMLAAARVRPEWRLVKRVWDKLDGMNARHKYPNTQVPKHPKKSETRMTNSPAKASFSPFRVWVFGASLGTWVLGYFVIEWHASQTLVMQIGPYLSAIQL